MRLAFTRLSRCRFCCAGVLGVCLSFCCLRSVMFTWFFNWQNPPLFAIAFLFFALSLSLVILIVFFGQRLTHSSDNLIACKFVRISCETELNYERKKSARHRFIVIFFCVSRTSLQKQKQQPLMLLQMLLLPSLLFLMLMVIRNWVNIGVCVQACVHVYHHTNIVLQKPKE